MDSNAPNLFLEWFFSPITAMLLMVAVSIVYFVSDRQNSIKVRLLISAHGVIGALLFMAAMLTWYGGKSSHGLSTLYAGMFVIPLASVIFSLIKFKGSRLIHLLQIPNLICLISALLIGTMAVSDDWL